MRVLTVVGARPQFVKAAVVSQALGEDGIEELLVHTGQHYDEALSGRFFEELGMAPPAVNLAVGSASHGAQTGRMLESLDRLIQEHAPDWVLVYGDTNSTLAAALAAAKLQVPVAHVEAGLRSFNRAMPEEINRVLTDHVSALLLTPTETAVRNLAAEGILGPAVRLVGDVMFDAALLFGGSADSDVGEPFVLATIHRAENTRSPERLTAIINGLVDLSRELPVVVPLHPGTRAALSATGLLDLAEAHLRVRPPAGYGEMLALERAAAVVVTDSGGVQKEAYFQQVPCVTLRDETEWVELVECGWNRLCPPASAAAIRATVLAAIGTRGAEVSLYGGGDARYRVVEALRAA